MTRKFLIAALAVVAFGCARSASTPATATVPSPRPRPVPVATPRAPRTIAAEPTKTTSLPPALHGPEKSYVEQIDNSGWSGRSPAPAPEGVGGGPPEYEGDEADDEQKSEK